MNIGKLSEYLGQILDISKEELEEELKEFLNTSIYIKRLQYVTLNEFWYNCLLTVYDLTDEITKVAYRLYVEVEPQSTFTHEIDLTGTNLTCICPIRRSAASIGPAVTLTVIVNEPPVDVKRQWQNKYAAIEEPQTAELRSARLCIYPKRKLKVIFNNTHSTEPALCTFYIDCMVIDFEKGKKMIEHCYREMAIEFMKCMGIKIY